MLVPLVPPTVARSPHQSAWYRIMRESARETLLHMLEKCMRVQRARDAIVPDSNHRSGTTVSNPHNHLRSIITRNTSPLVVILRNGVPVSTPLLNC